MGGGGIKIDVFGGFVNEIWGGGGTTVLIAFVMRKANFFFFFEAFLLLNSTYGFWNFIRNFPRWVYSRKMDTMIINYNFKLWNRKRSIFQ